MKAEEVKTPSAPSAIGPYSQGLTAGGFLFVSGQIPLDPASACVVPGAVAEQTRQVLENLKAVVESAGAAMADVVKTTVYMKDLAGFDEMNAVYGEFFSNPYPARATVEVKALPKGVLVEIDAIAMARGDKP